jgi:hypothetical protein
MLVRCSWLALLLLASCSTPADTLLLPAAAEAPPAEEARFAAIGDTIRMRAAGENPELTLEKRVDLDGTILLPELGALPVAGYTCSELEQLLARKWAPYFPQLELHVEIVVREAHAAPAVRGPAEGGGLLEGFRAWLREWFLYPPILIALGEPR